MGKNSPTLLPRSHLNLMHRKLLKVNDISSTSLKENASQQFRNELWRAKLQTRLSWLKKENHKSFEERIPLQEGLQFALSVLFIDSGNFWANWTMVKMLFKMNYFKNAWLAIFCVRVFKKVKFDFGIFRSVCLKIVELFKPNDKPLLTLHSALWQIQREADVFSS